MGGAETAGQRGQQKEEAAVWLTSGNFSILFKLCLIKLEILINRFLQVLFLKTASEPLNLHSLCLAHFPDILLIKAFCVKMHFGS